MRDMYKQLCDKFKGDEAEDAPQEVPVEIQTALDKIVRPDLFNVQFPLCSATFYRLDLCIYWLWGCQFFSFLCSSTCCGDVCDT